MTKMDNYAYFVLAVVTVFPMCSETIPKQTWFNCFEDYCNTDEIDEFCSDVFKMCRPCSEVLDDCFTPEMPFNCTKTCLDHYGKGILNNEKDKPCQIISEIDHGNHNGSRSDLLEPGTIIRYSCENGYRLVGYESLQCMQCGQWSSPPPKCEEVFCRVLTPVGNGTHNGSEENHAPGVIVVSSCNDGFQLYGQNITTCSEDGHWTNNLPICEPMTCTNPPPIRNGKWFPFLQDTNWFLHGNTLNARCDTGYSTDSPTLWSCHYGAWKSNASFLPNCFKQGESKKATTEWISLFVVSFICVLSISGNVVQYKNKRNQTNVEYGKRGDAPKTNIGSLDEEKEKLLEKEVKPNDSPEIVSLRRQKSTQATDGTVIGSQNVLPEPCVSNQPELPTPSNFKNANGNIVVNVHNFIENNNNSNAQINTMNENTGNDGDETTRKSAPEEIDRTDESQPEVNVSQEDNDNTPVQEEGSSIQPKMPDSPNVNVPRYGEDVQNPNTEANSTNDNQPAQPEEEMHSNIVPMESNPSIDAESLHIDLPGGTVPMKNASADRTSPAFVGTQPLKPGDGYNGLRETHVVDMSLADESEDENEDECEDDSISEDENSVSVQFDDDNQNSATGVVYHTHDNSL